jgi:oligopeptidase B
VVWPRTEGVEYDSSHAVIDGEDVLFILHNDGALDFELVKVRHPTPPASRGPFVPASARRAASRCLDFPRLGRARIPARGLARLGMLDYASGAGPELEFDEPLYSRRQRRQPEWAPR